MPHIPQSVPYLIESHGFKCQTVEVQIVIQLWLDISNLSFLNIKIQNDLDNIYKKFEKSASHLEIF